MVSTAEKMEVGLNRCRGEHSNGSFIGRFSGRGRYTRNHLFHEEERKKFGIEQKEELQELQELQDSK